MEQDELEWDLKNQELKLHTNFIDDCNKEVNAYGYVWSYDNEQPTVVENQGFVEIGQGNQLSSFDYSLTYGKGDIYVRAYVVYDENYVGYSSPAK